MSMKDLMFRDAMEANKQREERENEEVDKRWRAQNFCAECKKRVDPEKVGFRCETFVVCEPCAKATDEQWEQDKKMLREQGFDPDKCDFIERALNATTMRVPTTHGDVRD